MRPMIAGAGAGGGRLMEKQSLVPAVQELWNAWEIHCLILLSLFLQAFLFLFAGMRRRSHNRLLRLVLWLAYLSADSVAVFVLGHLAVRVGEPEHQLMAFWAPFLLIHLGGQDTITAFSKQDNQLYWRQLLNLVTQAGVALYVVAKVSWRPWDATMLVFFCGCFKYTERIVCLYYADPERLRGWGEHVLSQKLKGVQREEMREEANRKMEVTLGMMSKIISGTASELFWDAVTLVADIISVDTPLNQNQKLLCTTAKVLERRRIVPLAAPAADLPYLLEEFLSREDRHNAYKHVGELLGHCYRRLYTKAPIREVFIRLLFEVSLVFEICLRIFFLLWAIFPCVSTSIALALFMAAEKGGQLHHANRVDIVVSYSLLVGAIVLDVSSVAIFILTHLSDYLPDRILYLRNCIQPTWCKKQWSQELRQYNMINSARTSPIRRFFCYDVTCTPVTDHTSTTGFILDTLLLSGQEEAWNIASTRGQLALHKWQQKHPAHYARVTLKALEETIGSGVHFPISVLMWHIATDICYYFGGTNDPGQVEKHKQISRELSDYIMYLVYKCRVMLTTNSQLVHDNAKREIVRISSKIREPNLGDKDAAMKHFVNQMMPEGSGREQKHSTDEVQTGHEESTSNNNGAHIHLKKLQQSSQDLKSPVLPHARALAQELISIQDDAARWELIAAVWAEMLYYIAPRCGGSFHYEHLSTGGEFATHVLVLMYYLGPFLPPPDG